MGFLSASFAHTPTESAWVDISLVNTEEETSLRPDTRLRFS